MKKSLIGLSALVVLFTLSGCGLKGPLYFPPEETAALAKASDVQPTAQDSTAKEPAQTTNNQ
ncbi:MULTISPECIES: LPS translocon maturation chaperone LptM [Providencia]|uniref:LPS-assembly lipoprotein LptM n=1 Tax=Providencia huaxiensis TaxID=2027290 RepID=A0ABU2J233_9GAMM|nr:MULTISPECIES: lipoprotein [Providencia]AXH63706.1 cell envelope biogenesis protein OmpA [Providencia huaxiensis]MDT0135387.1 lipoprotein [Providencia huaxiensis]MDT1981792.1 lipoprotein [Providencia huaxiensis]QLR01053.1 lipoprotein [Providencia rettgeri]